MMAHFFWTNELHDVADDFGGLRRVERCRHRRSTPDLPAGWDRHMFEQRELMLPFPEGSLNFYVYVEHGDEYWTARKMIKSILRWAKVETC